MLWTLTFKSHGDGQLCMTCARIASVASLKRRRLVWATFYWYLGRSG